MKINVTALKFQKTTHGFKVVKHKKINTEAALARHLEQHGDTWDLVGNTIVDGLIIKSAMRRAGR